MESQEDQLVRKSLLRGVAAELLVHLPVLLLAVLVAVGHLGAFAAKTGSSSFVAVAAKKFSQRNLGLGRGLSLGPECSFQQLGRSETQHLVNHNFGREILDWAKARQPKWRSFGPRKK